MSDVPINCLLLLFINIRIHTQLFLRTFNISIVLPLNREYPFSIFRCFFSTTYTQLKCPQPMQLRIRDRRYTYTETTTFIHAVFEFFLLFSRFVVQSQRHRNDLNELLLLKLHTTHNLIRIFTTLIYYIHTVNSALPFSNIFDKKKAKYSRELYNYNVRLLCSILIFLKK